MRSQRPMVLLSLAAVLAACSAGASTTPTAPATSPAIAPVPTDEGQDPPSPAELPAWRTAALTDVRNGDTFRIDDFAGSLVVIEPMAAWCTSCLHQQREAAKALAAIDSERIVYISLDVDPTELPEDLAAYSEVRGFPWRFAIADRAVSRSLAETLGDQVLSPPSTPKIIITPEGEVVGPSFGVTSAEELEAQLRELLG